MDVNPYESPREGNNRDDFNWQRLSSIGLWTAAPCFAVLLIVPTFTFFSREHPILAVVTPGLMVLSLAGFFIGGIVAIVGWIASAASR